MAIAKLYTSRSKNKEEGFTLIELMIVVVIIGILAAIAIPIFANQQKAALATSVKSDVKNTVTNIATYLTRNPTASAVDGTWGPGTSAVQDSTSAAKYKIIRSDSTTNIVVYGAWDTYYMTATNTKIGPNAFTGNGPKYTATYNLVENGNNFAIIYNSMSGQMTQFGG